MSHYDMPPEIEIDADGPVRVVRLNRPEQLNATNHQLHKAIADVFERIDVDREVRAVVLTGNGRATSSTSTRSRRTLSCGGSRSTTGSGSSPT